MTLPLNDVWVEMCGAAADAWGWEVVFTVVITMMHAGAYWGGVGYYAMLKATGIVEQYKINHPARERGNSVELVKAAVVDAVVGGFFIIPALCYGGAWGLGFGHNICDNLPSTTTVATHVVASFLFTDTTFYWAHRALHHKSLYSWIHKQHHEFKATIPLASEYDHPIEDTVNALTTIGGPLLLHSHPLLLGGYISLRVLQTIDSHSGYSLPPPFSPWNIGLCWSSALRHDYHHTENIGNYGDWLPFWDWACGTDKSWKKYAAVKKE